MLVFVFRFPSCTRATGRRRDAEWSRSRAVTSTAERPEPTTIVGQLVQAALDPLAHTRPLGLSIGFAVTWCVGYGLFYSTFENHLRRLADG